MLGAIIGDIAGSIFEFHNYHNKALPSIFNEGCYFTDDTVMTCAVADALVNKKPVVSTLRLYGNNFIARGYGGSFLEWLMSDFPEPYNSFGNGAAMRVSPCAYIAKDEEDLKKLVRKVTKITHNHPEGMKGAEVIATCVYMALHKKSKGEIGEYAISKYPEIATMDYSWLNHNYRFNETCQGSVPQAIYCFLISDGFEDCIKTTISIGGDTDTLCAMSGAIAEAYYGIPPEIEKEVLRFFIGKTRRSLLEPVLKIYKKCGIKRQITL